MERAQRSLRPFFLFHRMIIRGTAFVALAATLLSCGALADATACRIPNHEAVVTYAARPVIPKKFAGARLPNVTALVRLTVGPDGRVTDAEIVQATGYAELDAAALQSVTASEYTPKVVDCKNLAGRYVFRVRFGSQVTPSPQVTATP